MKSRVCTAFATDRLKIRLQIRPVPSQPFGSDNIGLTCSSEDCRFRTYRPRHWTAAAPPTGLGPMLDLNDLFYFVQIVDRGGFTAAGRSLGMPKSTLSYRLQQLEAALGVRLLNRTSRHFGLTQAGEEFYRHALLMVRAAEEAESHARQRV